MSLLRKEKEDLGSDVNELRDQLYAEQKKTEINYRSYNEQMQEMYIKEQERRESEVRRERDERKQAEKEYQLKLDELQGKMERLLKEQQREINEEHEAKQAQILERH